MLSIFKNGLVTWISWVDVCLLLGHEEYVSKYHKMMKSYFECDNIGELKEYSECKIESRKG
jgi:hypothetical protein